MGEFDRKIINHFYTSTDTATMNATVTRKPPTTMTQVTGRA